MTSVVASIVAASVARTVTAPALTARFFSVAPASPRTSLSTTAPPIPIDGDCVKLIVCGTSWVPSTGFHRPRSV